MEQLWNSFRLRSEDRGISLPSPWDNVYMPNATITVDAALKARLSDLASQSGQRVDEFVEALRRRIANADIRFDRGVPVLPRRPGAPTLSAEDVDRLVDGIAD